MNVCRTIFLPPAKPRAELSYDRHQFKRRIKMVTKESGIDFGSKTVMSIHGRGLSNVPAPPWAQSDQKVQLVAVRLLWAMMHMTSTSFPQEEFNKDPLSLAIKLEDQLRKRCVNFAVQRNPIQRDVILGQKKNKKFGYARLLIRIIYETYRLKKRSNEIAAELHGLVTPSGVRQTLMRANKVARVIFPPEDNAPYDNRTGEKARQDIEYKRAQFLSGAIDSRRGRSRTKGPTSLELFKLTQSGRTAEDLAAEHNMYTPHVRRKICNGRREFFNIAPKRNKYWSPAQILRMHKEGCSLEEIAEAAQVQIAYVYCILTTKYGLDLSQPRVVAPELGTEGASTALAAVGGV